VELARETCLVEWCGKDRRGYEFLAGRALARAVNELDEEVDASGKWARDDHPDPVGHSSRE
jgi:hypothetical protein